MLILEAERQGGKIFMWKRILTLAMMLLTVGQVIVLPEQVVVKAKAAEVSTEYQIEETQATIEETEEKNYDIIEYEGNQYKIPHLSLNREPGVTESGYIERFTEVPHYYQSLYPDTKYGNSNIRKSGCGIACLSMVLTYLLDEEVPIEYLAQKYGKYKTKYGSDFGLFNDTASEYGLTVTKVSDWKSVKEALENGQVVVANPRSKSIFTDGGHYIVLSGLTPDGKILVRDPNLYNYSIWNYPIREKGYAEGFEEETLKYHCFPCWIYGKKDLDAIATRATQFDGLNFTATATDIESGANP